jgi:hypothetical protein
MRHGWAGWLDSVREYLKKHGRLPIPGMPGPALPSDLISDAWATISSGRHVEDKEFSMAEAMGEPPSRAAVLIYLWDLLNSESFGLLSEHDESEAKGSFRSLLREATSLVPVEEISEVWQLRWELLFAALAGDWSRAGALVKHWSLMHPHESDSAQISLARVYLLSVHPAVVHQELMPAVWVDHARAPLAQFSTSVATLIALRLDDRSRLDSRPWAYPATLEPESFGRVIDAEAALQRIYGSESGRTPEAQAIWAWCAGVQGARLNNNDRLREAAGRYQQLTHELAGVENEWLNDSSTRGAAAWCSAVLFRRAGDVGGGLEMARLLTELRPKSADAWKFRAEVERQCGSPAEWVPCYDKYRELADEADQSWEVTELLRLGYESLSRDAATRALRELAHTHRARATVEGMLDWDWPLFGELHPATRECWLDALLFVFDRELRVKFEHGLWRYAAERFGEAMERELKARLFSNFANAAEFKLEEIRREWEHSLALSIAEKRLSLGGIVTVLEQTTKNDSDLGRQLDTFLKRTLPELRPSLRSQTLLKGLRAAKEIRNRAAHEDVSQSEASVVYGEAKSLLELLASLPETRAAWNLD